MFFGLFCNNDGGVGEGGYFFSQKMLRKSNEVGSKSCDRKLWGGESSMPRGGPWAGLRAQAILGDPGRKMNYPTNSHLWCYFHLTTQEEAAEWTWGKSRKEAENNTTFDTKL